MKSELEIEAKWAVRSEAGFAAFRGAAQRFGARFGRPMPVAIQDRYMDTKAGLFGRSRVSCRLRRAAGRWELTLKGQTRIRGGMARRRERNIDLGPLASFAEARRRAQAWVRAVIGSDGLETIFIIANRRRVFDVRLPQGAAVEVCFDRVVISRRKRRVRMLEIEAELKKGSPKVLQAFARALRSGRFFDPSVRSKVATALAAFRLELPARGTAADIFRKVPA